MDQDEKIDADSYYDLLEKVKKISGIKDSELNKHSMVEVDLILQQISVSSNLYLVLNMSFFFPKIISLDTPFL